MTLSSTHRAACLLLITALWHTTAHADGPSIRLTAVFDKENLPYSSQKGRPEGLNVEIARLLALQMKVQLEIRWVQTENEGLLGLVIDPEEGIHMAVGVPIEPKTVEDEKIVGTHVLFSTPYASTRYVLATRKTHADVPEFKAVGLDYIGVEMGSVASGILWDRGHVLKGMQSQDEVLQALARGEVPYAVVWSNAPWTIRHDDALRDALTIQPAEVDLPGLQWNLAVAVGAHNKHLIPRINEAIEALRKAEAFQSFFIKYNTPYFEPIALEESSTP